MRCDSDLSKRVIVVRFTRVKPVGEKPTSGRKYKQRTEEKRREEAEESRNFGVEGGRLGRFSNILRFPQVPPPLGCPDCDVLDVQLVGWTGSRCPKGYARLHTVCGF